MPRDRDGVRLLHMLEHSREAIQLVSGRTRQHLETNRVLSLALVRLLEIVGEAAAVGSSLGVLVSVRADRAESSRLPQVEQKRPPSGTAGEHFGHDAMARQVSDGLGLAILWTREVGDQDCPRGSTGSRFVSARRTSSLSSMPTPTSACWRG
jgi:hypothetical protein